MLYYNALISVGHSGRFGHEFLEFDFKANGMTRYANNSNYRKDSLIRKEMCLSNAMVEEIKRIVTLSDILKEDDVKWPRKNKDGRQELEIRLGNQHISFEVGKLGSLADVQESDDPEGLRVFYYLVYSSSIYRIASIADKTIDKT